MLKRLFPIFERLPDYDGSSFKGDLIAGITVGIMLIPQGMAYSVLAGLPPVYGLYASLIPLILYGLLGTSRELAVGPVAMVSLLVFSGVSGYAEPGSERFIQLAILTALGVGLIQFIMGLLRMGFLVNFLSHPVLTGFTAAAAIIIGASQLKNLLGMNLPSTQQVHQVLIAAFQNFGSIHIPTALIGLGSLAGLILVKKWNKRIPAALLMVITGILVVAFFDLSERGVTIVGNIPSGLPSFNPGFLNLTDFRLLLPNMLVIALVGYMESIAVAKAIANRKGHKVNANQELIALGTANIGGSFFQAFPTTGGFSRTAVNNQAGANSGIASLISAGIIALTVLFLTPLFYHLPAAVLAAIIITAVITLFDYYEITYLWKTDKKDFGMLLITFLSTLFLGIETGIGVGVITSLAMVIYNSTKPHSTELGRLGNSNIFRNTNRFPDAHIDDHIVIYRFDSPLYFANVESFSETAKSLIKSRDKPVYYFILDASVISWIDSTGINVLKELSRDLKCKQVELIMASTRGPVRDKLSVSGLTDLIGLDNFYYDVADAMSALKHQNES
ncbi:MAG: solute carrier family 26 protein [Balneolales bacterium]